MQPKTSILPIVLLLVVPLTSAQAQSKGTGKSADVTPTAPAANATKGAATSATKTGATTSGDATTGGTATTASPGNSSGKGNESPGKSNESPGKSGESPGQSNENPAKTNESQTKGDETPAKANNNQAKALDNQGKANESQGKSTNSQDKSTDSQAKGNPKGPNENASDNAKAVHAVIADFQAKRDTYLNERKLLLESLKTASETEKKNILEQLRIENQAREEEERAFAKQIREDLKKLRAERKGSGQ